MKKFNFKFAAVQKVRKIREEEALRVLANSQIVYQSEIMKKENLLLELQNAYHRRDNLGKVATQISVFLAEQDYIVGLKQRIIQSDQAIFRASRNVEKNLKIYYTTRAQTKRIDTLFDKALAEFKREASKKEQKEIDEMILSRFRIEEESA